MNAIVAAKNIGLSVSRVTCVHGTPLQLSGDQVVKSSAKIGVAMHCQASPTVCVHDRSSLLVQLPRSPAVESKLQLGPALSLLAESALALAAQAEAPGMAGIQLHLTSWK